MSCVGWMFGDVGWEVLLRLLVCGLTPRDKPGTGSVFDDGEALDLVLTLGRGFGLGFDTGGKANSSSSEVSSMISTTLGLVLRDRIFARSAILEAPDGRSM